MGVGQWQVVCYTEEDWERLADKLEDTQCKDERALYSVLSEDFLPEIPRLFEEKERLQRWVLPLSDHPMPNQHTHFIWLPRFGLNFINKYSQTTHIQPQYIHSMGWTDPKAAWIFYARLNITDLVNQEFFPLWNQFLPWKWCETQLSEFGSSSLFAAFSACNLPLCACCGQLAWIAIAADACRFSARIYSTCFPTEIDVLF